MRISPRLPHPVMLGGLVLAGVSGLVISPILSLACIAVDGEETIVMLDFGRGKSAPIMVRLVDYEAMEIPEEDRPEDACHAWLQTELSNFPSVESRYGTGRIADTIAEAVGEWDASSCTVSVMYENDVGAEFAAHELCRTSRYGFEDGRVRSLASEAYCWEPAPEVPLEQVTMIE